jgi:beta-N-acetylhexosaminidase
VTGHIQLTNLRNLLAWPSRDMTDPMDLLRAKPFELEDADVAWVLACKAALTGQRRLAQLFNVMLTPGDDAQHEVLCRLQPGAITQFTLAGLEASVQAARRVQAAAVIPVLVSGDVEGGTICLDGVTPMPNQLAMAALPDAKLYWQALTVMMEEARSIGIDWTFSPVIDINADFRSAIVGTRSFGAIPTRVQQLGALHVKLVQSMGLAATVKHWPGEGFDARDQHLVTTVNPLSLDRWHEVFGVLYRDAIRGGVKTVMSGHIALPAYARSRGVQGLEAFRPASISKLLNFDLLRGTLGFNGLITSDASEMGGLSSWSPRSQHLPEIIENGCDMILFSGDLVADIAILEQALADGRLSEARVDSALTRVLALKASLGLHRRTEHPAADVGGIRGRLRTPDSLAISERVAAACITLVKDVQHVLPISPQRQRRITLIASVADSELTPWTPLKVALGDLLEGRGFEVRDYRPEQPPSSANTDLVLFVLAHESLMSAGVIFFDWRRLQGPMWNAMRRAWHDVPHVLISMGHPYYLNEAPRMPCVINAYTAIEPIQQALVRKLLGEEPFEGHHPVDAFCGHEDARY